MSTIGERFWAKVDKTSTCAWQAMADQIFTHHRDVATSDPLPKAA